MVDFKPSFASGFTRTLANPFTVAASNGVPVISTPVDGVSQASEAQAQVTSVMTMLSWVWLVIEL